MLAKVDTDRVTFLTHPRDKLCMVEIMFTFSLLPSEIELSVHFH